jgi:hypothetical protein
MKFAIWQASARGPQLKLGMVIVWAETDSKEKTKLKRTKNKKVKITPFLFSL